LGQVPRHWNVAPLKHVASFAGGGTPSREIPAFWNGDVPWVSPKDMKSEVIRDSEERITEAGLAAGAASLIEPNAVLIVVRSGILRHTIPVAINERPVALNQDMKALRLDEARCQPRFVLRLVQGMNDLFLNLWLKQGATVESIEHDFLARTEIPLPPPAEQRAIAAFLDRECGKIDGLVAEQERLIGLLKEKRQAVISHAVTKGLDSNAPMKDSGLPWLGQVPAHWEALRLGALFAEVAEDGEHDLPVLSVSIHSGVSDDELADEQLDRKVTRSEDRTKYKKVQPGDLVYNMMRAWQGGFGTVSVTGMVSPAYVVARATGAVRTQFIELLLRSPQAVEEMRRHSRGVTDFRLRLYWDEFKQIRVALPPLGEQEAILAAVAAEVSRSEALAAEAERAIELLKERRAALISAAVTGKIDVRGLGAAGAMENAA
jgi:type I restriction enzyme S subunit